MDIGLDSGRAVQQPDAGRGELPAVDGQSDGPLGCDDRLLRDAASVLLARRELDRLLVQLTAAPFSAAAYDGLRTYLAGPGQRAQAAYARVCASTGPAGR